MKTPRHRSLLTALALALALVIAGCGTDSDGGEPAASPTDDEQLPSDDATDNITDDDATDDDANGAAGTTDRVYSVPEARSSDADGSIHVVGLLIDDGSGWRLCEMVLESYPPQCGGDALTVEGLDASDLPLEESGEVRWQTEATVVGEIDGDTLTVTGSPASS